jgi:hypothetical protein
VTYRQPRDCQLIVVYLYLLILPLFNNFDQFLQCHRNIVATNIFLGSSNNNPILNVRNLVDKFEKRSKPNLMTMEDLDKIKGYDPRRVSAEPVKPW